MADKSYWDIFYTKNNRAPFEWLVDTSCIEQIVCCLKFSHLQIEKLSKTTFMLDVGCGSSVFSSRLSSLLSSSNYLLCADFSRQALELVKSNETSLNADFIQCDCRRLPIRDDVFELILDKGFIDSLLKNKTKAIESSLFAMNNILEKLNGLDETCCLVQITDECPELRISLFDQFDQSQIRIIFF
jgi:hypothetical protein